MPILRRSEQAEEQLRAGMSMLHMTGASTGSKMLTVNDLIVEPGADAPYHVHPNTEESIFLVDGDIEFHLDGHRFNMTSGDCVLAARGKGHGLKNRSDKSARLITVYPNANPQRDLVDMPELVEGPPETGAWFRAEAEPFEFMPGIMRFDMSGSFVGAESTYLSELVFAPGAIATNHYHPTTEESMFCLRGKLQVVYGKEDDISMAPGDMFSCEPGTRHGIFNSSDSNGTLLAIHPVTKPERVEVP